MVVINPIIELGRRSKISTAVKERYKDPNERIKTRESMIGKIIRTPEFCKQISERQKGMWTGEKHPNFGKHLSEEIKRKISIKNSGKKRSEETKKKISINNKNREPYTRKPHTEHTKQKISLAHKGKPSLQKGIPIPESQKIKLIDVLVGGFWYGNIRYNDPLYCDLWTDELRERVRSWYGHQCIECGTMWFPRMRKLHVHHVWYNKRTCCDNSPRSLVCLCAACHLKVRKNHTFWSQHFQEMIDSYYGGRCWLTKEEMKKWSS